MRRQLLIVAGLVMTLGMGGVAQAKTLPFEGTTMLEFGPTVQRAADQNEPSVITNLMIQLAGDIHSYLVDHHVIRAEGELRAARIALVVAARDLIRTGLRLLGVAAPDRM